MMRPPQSLLGSNPFTYLAMITIVMTASSQLYGQAAPITNPLRSHEVKLDVQSGKFYNNGPVRKVVWTEDITVDDAVWVKLNFSCLVLAGHPTGGQSSTLKNHFAGRWQVPNAQCRNSGSMEKHKCVFQRKLRQARIDRSTKRSDEHGFGWRCNCRRARSN